MEKIYYPVNEELAKRAKNAYSFDGYGEGSVTEEYRQSVDNAWALIEKRKIASNLSPEQVARLERIADRYARRLAQWQDAINRNTASCPSVMISGAGNFPVRRKEKQNAREGRLWEEYKEIQNLLNRLESIGSSNAIMSGDADAIERLQEKLDNLLDFQEEMKAANSYFRKHKTMKGYKDLTDEDAAKEDEKIANAYSWEKQPYPSYMLSNNNGSIKQVRDRIARLEREKATCGAEYDTEGLCLKVVENKEIMRLQVFFEGKPDDETRQLLKSSAFKWAPSASCWQRQLTDNARYALNRIIKTLNKR